MGPTVGQIDTTIRRIRSDDWSALREIRLRAILDSPGAFARTHEEESAYGPELWQHRAANAEASDVSVYFFAEIDDELVGLVGGYRSDESERPNLVSMWVAPSIRGTSAASKLAGAVIEWATNAEYDELDLWVASDNDRAIAFYRRLGFAETGERGPLASHPDKEELKMRRPLLTFET